MCSSRDGCAVNHAARDHLKGTFDLSDDMICFCHTLSCMGKRLKFESLDEFMTGWLTLVQNSPAAKSEWKSSIDGPMVGWSNIRWQNMAEVVAEIGRHISEVPKFLRRLEQMGIGEATTSKMIEVYSQDPINFELSVAAYMDLADIVKTTYEMEGERLEILVIFGRIEKIRALGRSLAGAHSGILVHTEAALRRPLDNPEIGLRFSKDFGSHCGSPPERP